MTYDPRDGYSFLFGGCNEANCGNLLNDAWTFQNGTWTQIQSQIAPSQRVGQTMTWDPIDSYLVLFGGAVSGSYLNDTWAFVGGAWKQLHPVHSPSGRDYASMAWDSSDGYAVLFGGNDVYGGMNDTWSFVGGNWTQLHPTRSPPGRANAAMVNDSADGYVVLTGGVGSAWRMLPLNDTWAFLHGNWTQLSPSRYPIGGYGETLAFDPALGGAVLFGGYCWSCTPSVSTATWWFQGGNWTVHPSVNAPPVSVGACAAYDPTSQSVVLFGGDIPNSGGYFYYKTWEYYSVNVTAAVNPAAGDVPVNLTLSAAIVGGRAPFNFSWSSSDGPTVFGSPAHYLEAVPGVLAIDAVVRDALNETTNVSLNVIAYPAFLLAAVGSPLSGAAPLNATFSASAAGGLPPYSFGWSLDGGSPAFGGTLTLSFSKEGTHAVNLTAADSFGIETTRSFPVEVRPAVLTPLAISASANRTYCEAPCTVGFHPGVAGGIPPYQYLWAFGDAGSSTSAEPSHDFEWAGTFEVNLTVSDSQGVRSGSSLWIVVHAPPSIEINASSQIGSAPFLVSFASNVSEGWAPYSVIWQFGDGAASIGLNATHTYSGAGYYWVTADVVDSAGGRATSASVAVNVAPPHATSPGPPRSSGATYSPLQVGLIGAAVLSGGALAVALTVWILQRRHKPRR